MRPRRLKLASGIWRFVVGPSLTTLWTPAGRKIRIHNWQIAGKVPGAHYCGDVHCDAGAAGPVTPGKLRALIEAHPDL